ncbi:MAG: hypothetical protein WBH82_03145 [Arcanobacterium sp.]
MTAKKTYPRTQAELDEYMSRYKMRTIDDHEGMFPMHKDLMLTDEQVQIVQDYIKNGNVPHLHSDVVGPASRRS